MKNKAFRWAPVATVLALAMVSAALAQKPKCKEFKGVINAYTPQTMTTMGTTTTATGPYEVRGPWSLRLKEDGTRADFSAALNMEFSDGWVLTTTGGNGNFDPAARGAHTPVSYTHLDVYKRQPARRRIIPAPLRCRTVRRRIGPQRRCST